MKYSFPSIVLKIIITLIILLYNNTLSGVHFVSKTGSIKPPYISWETAADSIQKCINICSNGDTIYVANGTYTEKITTIPGLTLIGGGQDSCFIDDRTISFDEFHAIDVTDSCTIEGFNVIVKDENNGLAFYCIGKAIIIKNNKIQKAGGCVFTYNCEIEVYNNNISYCGNGISLNDSRSKCHDNIISNAKNSIFMDNYYYGYDNYIYNNLMNLGANASAGIYASAGISIFMHTKPTIYNNIILMDYENADGIVSLVYPDTVRIFNNLILSKHALDLLYAPPTPFLIYNNFLYGPSKVYGLVVQGAGSVCVNNVIVNSKTGINSPQSPNIRVQYNNCFNNETNFVGFTPDSTNLSVDPMIVNADSMDFHLQMFSPLIDRGDPSILDPDSTRSDIGLYGGMLYGQSYAYTDYPPQPPKGLTAIKDSMNIKLSWNNNTEADFNHYLLYRDTTAGFTADSTKLISQLTVKGYSQIIPNNVNRLYYKLKAVDNQGKVSGISDEVGVIITGITGNENNIIQDYLLYQNYPNPFNPSTIISYRLKEEGYVKLTVYDIKGATVSNLVNRSQSAGYYEVQFTGNNKNKGEGFVDRFASGIYIYRIEITGRNNIPLFTDMKKMILLK
jgi:hypothetical protein